MIASTAGTGRLALPGLFQSRPGGPHGRGSRNRAGQGPVFRLVVEVTSGNCRNDLRNKVIAYAQAKVPVYVIVDREHTRIHVLTNPLTGEYDSHEVSAPGRQIALPDSIGAEVKLDAAELLKAGAPRRSDDVSG